MYLVYILQNKGFPVNEIFDTEVKSIPTMRFQEFLDSNPEIEEQMHGEEPDKEDIKNLFSFRSDDSYERLTTGPILVKKRPNFVPKLNLVGLPEYESSSDEEDNAPSKQVQGNHANYQESLKYIENFYNKYAPEMNKSSNDNNSINQLSYQDTLSRDEEDDDIREDLH